MPPREFKMGPQSAVARPQNRPGTSQDIDHLDNVKTIRQLSHGGKGFQSTPSVSRAQTAQSRSPALDLAASGSNCRRQRASGADGTSHPRGSPMRARPHAGSVLAVVATNELWGLRRACLPPHPGSRRTWWRLEPVYRNCHSCFPCASQLRFPGSDEDALF